jgi:transposase
VTGRKSTFNNLQVGTGTESGGLLRLLLLATKKSARRVLVGATTVGVDLGDQWSHYWILDEDGEITEEGRFRTTEGGVAKRFEGMDHARVAMEAGTHSIWISEHLNEYGHEMIVANVTELHAISRNDSKSDRTDAEKLARYARLDPRILRPITYRTAEQQQALTMIRARDALVRLRTSVVNAARVLAKPCGRRLPASSTRSFPARCAGLLPEGLAAALEPLFEQIAPMNAQIKLCDRAILKMANCDLSGGPGTDPGPRRRPADGSHLCTDSGEQGTLRTKS